MKNSPQTAAYLWCIVGSILISQTLVYFGAPWFMNPIFGLLLGWGIGVIYVRHYGHWK